MPPSILLRTLGFRKPPRVQLAARVNAVPSSAERLKALSGCGDPDRLRAAIGELCAEFGKLTSINIMTMTEAERRHALCFLRLESAAQEAELMTSLGAARFGGEVLVVVELPLG